MKMPLKDLFKDKKIVLYLGALLTAGILLQLLGGVLFNGSKPEESAAFGAADTGDAVAATESTLDYTQERELERRLEEAFGLVAGAGRVKVLVSMEGEKETVYAMDTNSTGSNTHETDANGGNRQTNNTTKQDKTVIITDKSGTDRALVSKEIVPRIKGVVIIAEGGDDVFVIDALTKAASTVLGIDVNKIWILKMKGE